MSWIPNAMLRRIGKHRGLTTDLKTLKKLRTKFANAPRKVPGRINVFGWDLEYVDGLSMVSNLEVIVVKGWNDFSSKKENPIILDCGANIGISVLNYKRLFPEARITAFEPDPDIVQYLRRNLKTNSADDVEVIEAAVWTQEGKSKFFCEGVDGSRLISNDDNYSETIVVRTVDLSEYVFSEIDFVKMDIEGGEFEVITHLGEKLRAIDSMVVECHIDNKDVAPFGSLLQTLALSGYCVSVNPYGAWRDLVKQPTKLPYEFDQYILVAAWRSK